MNYLFDYNGMESELEALFGSVFAASEGEDEGAVIASLVRDILSTTADSDLCAVRAVNESGLCGAILMTRLTVTGAFGQVFMLSPVAVSPNWQRKGIGQGMIRAGFDALNARGVHMVMTYGDPAYYGQVGFVPAPITDFPPPRPLTQPEGWLVRSLTDTPATPFSGPSRCVAAFDRDDIW